MQALGGFPREIAGGAPRPPAGRPQGRMCFLCRDEGAEPFRKRRRAAPSSSDPPPCARFDRIALLTLGGAAVVASRAALSICATLPPDVPAGEQYEYSGHVRLEWLSPPIARLLVSFCDRYRNVAGHARAVELLFSKSILPALEALPDEADRPGFKSAAAQVRGADGALYELLSSARELGCAPLHRLCVRAIAAEVRGRDAQALRERFSTRPDHRPNSPSAERGVCELARGLGGVAGIANVLCSLLDPPEAVHDLVRRGADISDDVSGVGGAVGPRSETASDEESCDGIVVPDALREAARVDQRWRRAACIAARDVARAEAAARRGACLGIAVTIAEIGAAAGAADVDPA